MVSPRSYGLERAERITLTWVVNMSEMNREELQKEISKLKEEHAALDARVEAFNEQVWLSPEDQVAQKECKKLKLKTKELMTDLQNKLDGLDK